MGLLAHRAHRKLSANEVQGNACGEARSHKQLQASSEDDHSERLLRAQGNLGLLSKMEWIRVCLGDHFEPQVRPSRRAGVLPIRQDVRVRNRFGSQRLELPSSARTGSRLHGRRVHLEGGLDIQTP